MRMETVVACVMRVPPHRRLKDLRELLREFAARLHDPGSDRATWDEHVLRRALRILEARGFLPPSDGGCAQRELEKIILAIAQEETEHGQRQAQR